MSRTFLFNNPSSSSSKHLVEFKAGKMVKDGTKVTPLMAKGTVYLNQSEDSLMHFCWKNRTTGHIEDDFIIFPEDAEFKRVSQCTTGRVYVLKFKSSSRRCFYWMQDFSADKDDENCKKINQYLNNPPAQSSRSTGGASGSGFSDSNMMHDNDIQNLLHNIDPQQLLQLLGMPNNSSRSQSSSSPRPVQSPVANFPRTQPTTTSNTGSTPVKATTDEQQQPASNDPDAEALVTVLNSHDSLKALIENQDFMKKVEELLPPTRAVKEETTSKRLELTVRSSPYQYAVRKFVAGFHSGQLGPLLKQFGFNDACVTAANHGDVTSFVQALELEEKRKKPESNLSKESESDDKDENRMVTE